MGLSSARIPAFNGKAEAFTCEDASQTQRADPKTSAPRSIGD